MKKILLISFLLFCLGCEPKILTTYKVKVFTHEGLLVKETTIQSSRKPEVDYYFNATNVTAFNAYDVDYSVLTFPSGWHVEIQK